METLILMLSSVLGTLGIVLVIWLISSVRSAHKQLKSYPGGITIDSVSQLPVDLNIDEKVNSGMCF